MFNFLKKKSDPIREALGGFQDGFTKEQKAVVMIYLIAISAADGKFLPQTQKEIEFASRLIGIDSNDPIYDSFKSMPFADDAPYYVKVLNSLTQSQKEWLLTLIDAVIAAGENEGLNIKLGRALKILENIGISEDDYFRHINKARAIYNRMGF